MNHFVYEKDDNAPKAFLNFEGVTAVIMSGSMDTISDTVRYHMQQQSLM